LRIFPTSAIQFLAYENYKKAFLGSLYCKNRHQKDLTPTQRLVAGGLAGITALTTVYPLELIRARMTIQITRQYRGIAHALSSVVKQGGFIALYKGLWPSIVGVVPYVGIDFAVYETLKDYVPKNDDGSVSTPVTLSCGAIAGAAGQTVAYPLDVIRRRLQVQDFAGNTLKIRYNGIGDAIKKIYKMEGFSGFYTGLVPNYLKVVPAIAVSFEIYERMKQLLGITRPTTKVTT